MAELTRSEKLQIPAYIEGCIRKRRRQEAWKAERDRERTWAHIHAVMSGIHAAHELHKMRSSVLTG